MPSSTSKNFAVLLFFACFTRNDCADVEDWLLTGGTLPPTAYDLRETFFIPKRNLRVPRYFDARERWPHCESIRTIRDQGKCGACWAVASAAVISDRWCIAFNQTLFFSAEDMLTCCPNCVKEKEPEVCNNKGNARLAMSFWTSRGLVTGGDFNSGIGCKPYSASSKEGKPPPCEQSCTNKNYNISYEQDMHIGLAWQTWKPGPLLIKDLQMEIMLNGPVLGFIQTPVNIREAENGRVFKSKELQPNSFRAVRLLGWGNEDGLPYWLIATSLGPDWGKLGGCFKLLRGVNELGFETSTLMPQMNIDFTGTSSAKIVLFSKDVMLFCLIFKIFLYLFSCV